MNTKKNTKNTSSTKLFLSLGILIAVFLIGSVIYFNANRPAQTPDNSEIAPGSETENSEFTDHSESENTESAGTSETEDNESSNNSETEESNTENSEQITDSETENTESESETTPDSDKPTPDDSLSYAERCELDYVAPPVKRTREEAIEKIKELSELFPDLYHVYTNAEKYPSALLRAGAGNPEMTDFLYGYLTREPVVTGGFTDEERPEDYPLFLQWDIRWGYVPYGSSNIGGSGCGPTCLSMAVFYLTGNRECTPDVVSAYSVENGHYMAGTGTAWSLLTAYPKEFGLKVKQPKLKEDILKAELDKGNILICSVRAGDFTSSGHFIVIYGYDENGFKVNDPLCVYRSRLSWTYEQIQDDIKNTWSIGY